MSRGNNDSNNYSDNTDNNKDPATAVAFYYENERLVVYAVNRRCVSRLLSGTTINLTQGLHDNTVLITVWKHQ